MGIQDIAWADSSIHDLDAVHAILGEARGEGYDGMYAVACALRNRGHLKGVYGLRARLHPNDLKLAPTALKAWKNSLCGKDVTHGATHWENVEEFGTPFWAKAMTKTCKIGRHTFFRETL